MVCDVLSSEEIQLVLSASHSWNGGIAALHIWSVTSWYYLESDLLIVPPLDTSLPQASRLYSQLQSAKPRSLVSGAIKLLSCFWHCLRLLLAPWRRFINARVVSKHSTECARSAVAWKSWLWHRVFFLDPRHHHYRILCYPGFIRRRNSLVQWSSFWRRG